MQLYESRLNDFIDKARINYCKSRSVHQHGGPLRPRQNCHSCIFETKENSILRIYIQYLGNHSKTSCQKSAKSMRCHVRRKIESYRKSLLYVRLFGFHTQQNVNSAANFVFTSKTGLPRVVLVLRWVLFFQKYSSLHSRSLNNICTVAIPGQILGTLRYEDGTSYDGYRK